MTNDRTHITSWLQPQEILLDVDVSDQAGALKFIAESTALGDGFAIPHTRIGGIARPLTLFIRTKQGIEFHAPDGKPVSDLLAIMVPVDGDKNDHLQLLSLVVRLFSDRAFRDGLDNAPDAAAAEALFRSAIRLVEGDVS